MPSTTITSESTSPPSADPLRASIYSHLFGAYLQFWLKGDPEFPHPTPSDDDTPPPRIVRKPDSKQHPSGAWITEAAYARLRDIYREIDIRDPDKMGRFDEGFYSDYAGYGEIEVVELQVGAAAAAVSWMMSNWLTGERARCRCVNTRN